MSIMPMRGGEAKGLATTGGAVSPSLRKKKLSSLLTFISSKKDRYGEKAAYY